MSDLDHVNARVERLEEAQAFDERRGEQLSGEIAELGARVLEFERRLERLEGKLQAMTERVGEIEDRGIEPPPHASGPDVPKDPI